MSYKIYFGEKDSNRFYAIDFLKKYSMLYDVLDNLFTSKITIDNVNADQITFIIDLIHGYEKNDLFSEKRRIGVKKKGKSWKKDALTKTNIFLKKY